MFVFIRIIITTIIIIIIIIIITIIIITTTTIINIIFLLSFNRVETTRWQCDPSATGWSPSPGGSSLPQVRNVKVELS